MIHEYALDPETLTDWPTVRYLLDQFGAPNGRLISQFPKHWKRLAYEACRDSSPIDKKRIEERLVHCEKKLTRTGRPFDSCEGWIENAFRSHAERPFRLILSHAGNVSRCAVDVTEVGPETPGWLPDSAPVARTAEELAMTALPLIFGAKQMILADPHFSCAARHCKPLERIVALVHQYSNVRIIHYHLLAKKATPDYFRTALAGDRLSWVRAALKDRQIHFFRWKQREGGEAFHARYILTDRGGLNYEQGLDEGSDGEHTDVHRMDDDLYQKRWKSFCPESGVYELIDVWCLSATTVNQMQ